jgi:hypothetical protein
MADVNLLLLPSYLHYTEPEITVPCVSLNIHQIEKGQIKTADHNEFYIFSYINFCINNFEKIYSSVSALCIVGVVLDQSIYKD